MDDKEKLAFLTAVLAEAIEELMVHKVFEAFLCDGPFVGSAQIEEWLELSRADTDAKEKLRKDWQVYLGDHLADSQSEPGSVLRKFLESWRPANRRGMN